MNLIKLFEMQKVLDDRIVREKRLEGRDTLPEKILALQVELGECANEWRGFKFWSEDREPRSCVINREGETANEYYKNPLLEEYVDCLHFILSIGLSLKMNMEDLTVDSDYTTDDAVTTFSEVFDSVSNLVSNIRHSSRADLTYAYELMLNLFVGLGEKYLGFTWDQIEQAYYSKNEINHVRQAEGY